MVGSPGHPARRPPAEPAHARGDLASRPVARPLRTRPPPTTAGMGLGPFRIRRSAAGSLEPAAWKPGALSQRPTQRRVPAPCPGGRGRNRSPAAGDHAQCPSRPLPGRTAPGPALGGALRPPGALSGPEPDQRKAANKRSRGGPSPTHGPPGARLPPQRRTIGAALLAADGRTPGRHRSQRDLAAACPWRP